MFVPSGSKVLGDAAEGDALVDMVTAMLGRDLRRRAAGRRRVGGRRAAGRLGRVAVGVPSGVRWRDVLVRDVVIGGATAEDSGESSPIWASLDDRCR